MDKILKASVTSLFLTAILYIIYLFAHLLIQQIILLLKDFNCGPMFYCWGTVWLGWTIWITIITWDD